MKRSKNRSRKEWTEIIAGQRQSGLMARAFCRREGVGLASFYSWRRRLRDSTFGSEKRQLSKGTFVELEPLGAPGFSTSVEVRPWVVTLDLGEGIKLSIQRC